MNPKKKERIKLYSLKSDQITQEGLMLVKKKIKIKALPSEACKDGKLNAYRGSKDE